MTKTKITLSLHPDLVERARNTVVYLQQNWAGDWTLSGVTHDALARELKRLEKHYNNGKPFPNRKGNLRAGRCIK